MASSHPLEKYRKDKGLSREALGKELGVSGVTVGRWENKKRKVADDLLSAISEKTGIPQTELRPDLAKKLGLVE